MKIYADNAGRTFQFMKGRARDVSLINSGMITTSKTSKNRRKALAGQVDDSKRSGLVKFAGNLGTVIAIFCCFLACSYQFLVTLAAM